MCSTSGGSWIEAIFDEIALEGLEGVTLPSLWELLATRLQCGSPLPEQLQQQIWTLILRSNQKLKFYELPAPRPMMPPYNRCDDLDEQLGMPKVPEQCPFLRYPYAPVQDGAIIGNCADYTTRKKISASVLRELNALQATERWQQTLVVVASQEQRFLALTPPNVLQPKELTPQQYCIWEAIGRSRYNGETSVGPWSLQSYSREASVMFYIKNKLLRLQIIASQAYTEKRNDRPFTSSLLMLPRFFRIYKSRLQTIIEMLYVELKARDEPRIPLIELSENLFGNNKGKTLRKLMLSHAFCRVFETKTMIPEPNSKKRKLIYVQLRNPAMSFDELHQSEGENKEEKIPAFASTEHAYVDMPVEEECQRAIMRHGARGCSIAQLSQYTGICQLSVRGIIKYMQKENIIGEYQEHVGKQRLKRFVAKSQAEQIECSNAKLDQTLRQLQCKPEPTMPSNAEIVLADLPEISAQVRDMAFEGQPPESKTQRQVQRMELIVQFIDEKCIAQAYDLVNYIHAAEKAQGYSDIICRKSLRRLLHFMRESKILNVYEATLQYQHHLRLYRLVTHPKIDLEHKLLQRELLRLKNNFYLIIEERYLHPSQLKPLEREKLAARKANVAASAAKAASNAKTASALSKQRAPKFLVARVLHELLFYIQSELVVEQPSIEMSAELLQQWQRTEPALQSREFLEQWRSQESHVLPYADEINWRTFVPPLPKYEDKPAGWLYFMDAIERMPLSIFNKIFRLEREAAEQLRPYLQHPIRQHYLVQQLEPELRGLVPRLQWQQSYIGALRLLNHLGLVQVTERQLGRDPLQIWVYLNRHTRILDTTSSEASYKSINPARSYIALKYEFQRREDIAQYWVRLQHVCIYTKLGFRRRRDQPAGVAKRSVTLSFVGTVEFEQALALDNGSVAGDQLGAAGLGSQLYAHQYRHWSWVQQKSTPTPPLRKRLALSQTRLKQPKQVRKVRARAVGSSLAGGNKRSKYGPRDDIDRDALKNMRTLRVTWTPEEDRLLKMGRAVYVFIDAPVPALGLYNVGTVCRDVIRFQLGICNKTTQACVRRMQFLMRMKRDTPDVPNWIYMMQTQPEFCNTYNVQFLTALKREYPKRAEHNDALLIHFVLILAKLRRVVSNAQGSMRRQFILPDSLAECQRVLRECTPIDDEQQLHYANPSSEHDLLVTMAQCVLHSTLCCAKDKTLYNLQAFEIYKHFSEDVLSAAFNKARAEGLVVAVRRRQIQVVNRGVSGPAYLLSSKYRYRLMYLKLSHAVYDSYYDYAQRALSCWRGTDGGEKLSIHSPTFAQLLLLGEWLASGRLRVALQLPNNILTVDTTSLPRANGSDRILDHFSCIFDQAPQPEYAKRMESECSGRQSSRVRFHPANLSYKLQCSPYDQLSKLPQRAMHFFCALDQLGQEEVQSLRLDALTADCPFQCIMRSGNYLNAVERIVHEQRGTLKQLVADALPQSQILSNSVAVDSTNLLSVVHQLEAHWRQLEQPHEVKDLGRAAAERTLQRRTDWRPLCAALLEYEPQLWEAERAREYEPALNKEERARAQDVFVVHLPELQLSAEPGVDSQKLQQEMEQQHKAVIEKVGKETYWHYSENTFETLRPTLQERGYDTQAVQHLWDIEQHIGEQPLGVLATELRRRFPLGKFLLDALQLLAEHELIKRVGVASFMYVHKRHMRNWVVHTFHIKRLERERVQTQVAATPDTPLAVAGRKRQLEEAEQPSTSSKAKKGKLSMALQSSGADSSEEDAGSDATGKRKRRCQRKEPAATPIISEVAREVIVMRPQPWIRVNASLNRRVLDRWLGAVLCEGVTHTGCTVQSICLRYPHLLPVDIMLLLELLCDLECIHLMELHPPKLHVESVYEECAEEKVMGALYEPTLTYVVAHGDAVARLTNFIGLKKYSAEFV